MLWHYYFFQLHSWWVLTMDHLPPSCPVSTCVTSTPPSLYPQTSFSPAWQKFSLLILSILLTPIENHNIFSSATSGSAPVFSSAPRSPNHASQSVSLPSRKPSFHSCCPKSPWHSSPATPPLLHFLYLCCALPVDKVTTQKYSNQSWINQRCAQL